MTEFKERLRFLRKSNKLSMQELAKELHCTYNLISMYESGKRMPSRQMLEAIADYFNVDMDYLLGKSEIQNRFRLEQQNRLLEYHKRLIEHYDSADEKKKKMIDLLLNLEDEDK